MISSTTWFGRFIVLTFLLCQNNPHSFAQFGEERFLLGNPTSGARRVAVADIDMDGDPDLLVGAVDVGRVVWQPNLGGGTFGTPRVVLDLLPNARAVALDDVDNDGDPDLICSQDDSTILLLLNGGYGNFGEPVVIATGVQAAFEFQLADLDGDGDADIVACASTTLNVILSNGGGSYQPAVTSTISISCTEFGMGDLTGDGRPDMLIRSQSTANNCLAYRAGNGAGGFGPVVYIATNAQPRHLASIHDVDGDGDNDVLAELSFELKLFRNNGNGTFTAPVTIPESEWIISTDAVDLDADGLMDLLLGTWTGLYLKRGSQGITSTASELLAPAAYSKGLHIADLDQDGRLDVAVAAYGSDCGLWVVRQPSPGEFTNERLSEKSYGPYSADDSFADVDGDGLPDYFTRDLSDGLRWSKNLNYLSFGPWSSILPPGDRNGAQVHDMDGDGDPDILCSTNNYPAPSTLAWYENDGQMGFATEHVIASGSLPVPGMCLDADGDGDMDVISAMAIGSTGFQLFLNDGAGSFSVSQTVSFPAYINGMRNGDLNGDGLADALMRYQSHGLVVYLNLGDGVFGPGQTIYTGSVQQEFNLGDLDGDGDLDVVFGETSVDRSLWLANTGAGTFGSAQFVHADAPNAGDYLVFDQNLDGYPDVLAMDRLYMGLGNGQFAAGVTFGRPGLHHLIDLDGDGDLDLAGSSYSPNWLIGRENLGNSPYAATGAVFHDMDGDGVQAPGENGLPFIDLHCSPTYSSPTTDPTGEFTFPLQQGSWTISTQLPDALWELSTDSAAYHIAVSDTAPVATGLAFGFAPTIDTSLVVTSLVSSRPRCIGDGSTTQWITVANVGTTRPTSLVRYELGPGASFSWSIPQPDSIVDQWIYWHMDSIGHYQHQRILLVVQLPTEPGTLVSGHVLTWLLNDGAYSEQDTTNWSDVVPCSYDPNDKQVSPVGIGSHGRVPLDTEYLYYNVRFQNTGTDTAYTVEIRDVLDNALDPNSLQLLGTSHDLTHVERNTNGMVSFRFDNILLPDSNINEPESHGFVRFRIRPHIGPANGTVVHNTAAIYFDINDPVITNTTTTTLADCALLPSPFIVLEDGVLLEASAGSGYQWYFNGGPLPGATEQTLLASANGYYSVQVIGQYDCLGMSEEVYVGTVGTSEAPSLFMRVHPNPSTSETRIHFSEPVPASCTLELIDVHGHLVRTWDARQGVGQVLQWNDQAPGIYLLRLSAAGQVIATLRIIRM